MLVQARDDLNHLEQKSSSLEMSRSSVGESHLELPGFNGPIGVACAEGLRNGNISNDLAEELQHDCACSLIPGMVNTWTAISGFG